MNELCRIFEISVAVACIQPIPQSAEKQALMQSIETDFSLIQMQRMGKTQESGWIIGFGSIKIGVLRHC